MRGANVSVWLERALQLFRVTLLKCLPLATVAMLCSDVPNLYWIATGHTLTQGLPKDVTYWVLNLIAAALALYLASAVMLQQRSIALGVAFNAGTALAAAARRLPVLLLTWVLAQLSLVVGFSLLVVPGIFLLVCYLVLLPVVMFERHNPYLALVRCVLLVRSHWWQLLFVLVITVVVVLAAVLVVAAALEILATLLAGQGPAFDAIVATGSVAIGAIALALLTALMLTLHSALASSSA
jgi:hypothetical protein